MEIVKFIQDPISGGYSYKEESSKEMLILGQFFEGHFFCSSYVCSWVEKAKDRDHLLYDQINLEIQQSDVLLKDIYVQEGEGGAVLRIKKQDFIKLCDDWRNVILKLPVSPRKLEILYENREYRLKMTTEPSTFKAIIRRCLNAMGHPVLNKEITMEIVKFVRNPAFIAYSYIEDLNMEMIVLNRFFGSCFFCSCYICIWAVGVKGNDVIWKNFLSVKIQQDDVLFEDMHPKKEEVFTILRMKKKQFIKLCDEFLEVVCKASIRPKELAIIYENNEYQLQVKKDPFSLKAFIGRWFYQN